MVICEPDVYSMPSGVSAPIRAKPPAVVSMACMTRSAPSADFSPYSPKVLIVSSPPKTDW